MTDLGLMFAVIKTGGKQYKVAEEDILVVERLDGVKGDIIELTDVLMLGDGAKAEIGEPVIKGASVAAEVIDQNRSDKIIVFKKKRRKKYRRTAGHRQNQTVLRITEILTDGKKPSKAKAVAKKPAAKTGTKARAKTKPSPKSGSVDDLGLISGVGPALVKKLEALGYTTFKQIAELKSEEIAKVDEQLNFKGRIEREDWVNQAKELMAGKAPRAKVGKKAAAKSAAAKKN